METQYDISPHTGEKHPPSKDCMMIINVHNALSEPRLHCCLEGGPSELAEYKLEVVNGIKNHWVKQNPSDTEWTYSYNGRLFNWGSQLNFATKLKEGVVDPQNPWVQLAYVKAINNELLYEIIPPVNQIEHIINTLVEAPYSRRAIALTGFPPGDKSVDDPPCLRYLWCRGRYDDCLKIDMHVHFRSRDAYGAALFNMYALTELQRYIVFEIQDKLVDMRVEAGNYVDISDSYHIYGHKLKEFENRFINSALKQPRERRFWDLSTTEMQELLKEGEQKAYKLVKSIDEKNNRTNLSSRNENI